jgi:predicted TPR repeat methyltransferase
MQSDAIAQQYDKIAQVYDDLFVGEDDLNENKVVGTLISHLVNDNEHVYEIGCGTGLLLSLINVQPQCYKGIDISGGMIKKFAQNHPSYIERVKVGDVVEDAENIQNADCIVGIFGSLSYLPTSFLAKLSSYNAHRFFMFYKDTYIPVTYQKSGVSVEYNKHSYAELKELFPSDYVFAFNNYYIVMTA